MRDFSQTAAGEGVQWDFFWRNSLGHAAPNTILKQNRISANTSICLSPCNHMCHCPDSYGVKSMHALLPAWIFMNMCHLVWRSHTFSTGSAIESDHSSRFMSIGQYAFTAEQFLSPGSVTTFHILLPHVQTWMALNSLRDQDSLPLNLSLRL